jgi:hypothetical protein
VIGRNLKRLKHVGDHVWLGHCLSFADGNGVIGIGPAPELRGNELVTWNTFHGCEHTLVAQTSPTQLDSDHVAALRGKRVGCYISGHLWQL